MGKRKTKRIIAGYKAEIIFDNKTYQGIIENLSETGVSVTVAAQETGMDLQPGKELDLKFQIQPGETLTLHCKIVWSSKLPPHNMINSIGLEIIDPPWEESNCFL